MKYFPQKYFLPFHFCWIQRKGLWKLMGWILEQGKNTSYWTVPEWAKFGVKLGFSTVQGGQSTGCYSSLNLALHVNDNPSNVLNNRKLFLAEFDCSLDDCIAAEQVHGTKVQIVTSKQKSRGMYSYADSIPACDGLLTADQLLGLMAFFADCVPLYFYCPTTKMIGLAHAGWRGTVNNIVKKMLNELKLAGSSVAQCHVAIGPSIGACCYQVSEDVAAVFREKFRNPYFLTATGQDKFYLDLKEANRYLLISEGVLPENIISADLCTFCQTEYFYSFRRAQVTGRMAAFIIRKDCEQHGGSIVDGQNSPEKT